MRKTDVLQVSLLADALGGERSTLPKEALEALAEYEPRMTKIVSIGGTTRLPSNHSPMSVTLNIETLEWSNNNLVFAVDNVKYQERTNNVMATNLLDGTILVIAADHELSTGNAFIAKPLGTTNTLQQINKTEAIAYGWRPNGCLVTLRNGHVVRIGGDLTKMAVFPAAAIYDPGQQKWQELARFIDGSFTAEGMCCVVMADGNVLISGGRVGFTILRGCYIFLADSHLIRHASDMPEARWLHAGCLLDNGDILVCGGLGHTYTSYTAVSSSTSRYTPTTGEWSEEGEIGINIHSHVCITLPRDRIFIGGGHSSDIAVYDLKTKTSKKLIGDNLPTTNFQPGCTFIALYE